MNPKFMTLEDFTKTPKLRIEAVELPEWNSIVYVREMTALERDSFETSISDNEGNVINQNLRSKLIVATACDPEGTLLFNTEHLAMISGKPAPVMMRIYEAAARLNQMRSKDRELGKVNSGGAENGSSQ